MSAISIIKRTAINLINTSYWSVMPSTDLLYIKSGTVQHMWHAVPFNFGDDLNYHFLQEITSKRVVNIKDTFLKKTNYLVIGSIIEKFCDSLSVIWGAGAMYGVSSLKQKPALVTAVRGELTRDYLVRQGINCPDVYGDPALLLPFIYSPQRTKHYSLGIIPHYVDNDNSTVLELKNRIKDSTIIKMVGYSDWHSVVDQICECEAIVSSSLHGLIVSDAYQIPNVWLSVSDSIKGGSFKYLDYFSSVGRDSTCLNFSDRIDFVEIKKQLEAYNPIRFDAQRFINSCPFPLNDSFVAKVRGNQV